MNGIVKFAASKADAKTQRFMKLTLYVCLSVQYDMVTPSPKQGLYEAHNYYDRKVLHNMNTNCNNIIFLYI